MDLRDYLRVLRKGWPLILAFVVLGLAAGIGLTLSTTKVYQADSQVYINVSSSNGDTAAQGQTYAQGLAQTMTAYATSPKVTDPVISSLHLNLTDEQLGAKITADAPLNKSLINLHVTDTSPRRAARISQAVTDRFITVVQDVTTDARGQQFTKLSTSQPPRIPSAPIKPNKVLNIGLGFVVGLLVGVGVVVLRDVLDNTIKSPADFAEHGVPAMGIVPFDKRTAQTPIAFRADPNGARSEAYRQIRTNLQFVDVDNPPKIISVTSAVPGEGKSTTALNLAAALAEAGSRVCLVEADLRRPSLARALGLIGDVGFTTALIGKTPVEDVLQNAGQNLAVLTSGPIPPNPSELLITDHARQIIEQVATHVDFVVVDTPPLLPVTDGATVATLADATLLVARTGKTSREQAARSVDALEKVGKRPVGVVLNMVTRGRGGYSYEYGYYYTAAERPRRMGRGVGVAAGQAAPDDSDSPLDLLTGHEDEDDAGTSPRRNQAGYQPAHAPETTRASAAAPEVASALETEPVLETEPDESIVSADDVTPDDELPPADEIVRDGEVVADDDVLRSEQDVESGDDAAGADIPPAETEVSAYDELLIEDEPPLDPDPDQDEPGDAPPPPEEINGAPMNGHAEAGYDDADPEDPWPDASQPEDELYGGAATTGANGAKSVRHRGR